MGMKRLVLVCEDSLYSRKLPAISGPNLGEVGCYKTGAASRRRDVTKQELSGRLDYILVDVSIYGV